tara:strand:- start:7862 stop:8770 length:909 start_codon:yes stop_codon:yes gene_type:complete
MKFNRQYRLLIQEKVGSSNSIEVQAVQNKSLTIQFDVVRDTGSSANNMTLRIYNLNHTNRSLIFQDRVAIQSTDKGKVYKKIVLQAGYDNLSTIFVGNILEAYSYKQGADIITYIRAQDGGFSIYNTYSSFSLQKGVNNLQLYQRLIKDMTENGLAQGVTAPIVGSPKRAIVIAGNTWDCLQNSFNKLVFIDLEAINYLEENQGIIAQVPFIDSSAGLLGTPRRSGATIIVEMIFEPRIIVGQLIELSSITDLFFNGQFKVSGVQHVGIISSAVGGELKTVLQLYIGSKALSPIATSNVLTF